MNEFSYSMSLVLLCTIISQGNVYNRIVCTGDKNEICSTGFCHDALDLASGQIRLGCAVNELCTTTQCQLMQNQMICCCSQTHCNGKSHELLRAELELLLRNNIQNKQEMNQPKYSLHVNLTDLKRLEGMKSTGMDSENNDSAIERLERLPILTMLSNTSKSVNENDDQNENIMMNVNRLNSEKNVIIESSKRSYSVEKRVATKRKDVTVPKRTCLDHLNTVESDLSQLTSNTKSSEASVSAERDLTRLYDHKADTDSIMLIQSAVQPCLEDGVEENTRNQSNKLYRNHGDEEGEYTRSMQSQSESHKDDPKMIKSNENPVIKKDLAVEATMHESRAETFNEGTTAANIISQIKAGNDSLLQYRQTNYTRSMVKFDSISTPRMLNLNNTTHSSTVITEFASAQPSTSSTVGFVSSELTRMMSTATPTMHLITHTTNIDESNDVNLHDSTAKKMDAQLDMHGYNELNLVSNSAEDHKSTSAQSISQIDAEHAKISAVPAQYESTDEKFDRAGDLIVTQTSTKPITDVNIRNAIPQQSAPVETPRPGMGNKFGGLPYSSQFASSTSPRSSMLFQVATSPSTRSENQPSLYAAEHDDAVKSAKSSNKLVKNKFYLAIANSEKRHRTNTAAIARVMPNVEDDRASRWRLPWYIITLTGFLISSLITVIAYKLIRRRRVEPKNSAREMTPLNMAANDGNHRELMMDDDEET